MSPGVPKFALNRLEKRARKAGMLGTGEGFIDVVLGAIDQLYIEQTPTPWKHPENTALCLTRQQVLLVGQDQYQYLGIPFGQIDRLAYNSGFGLLHVVCFQAGALLAEFVWAPQRRQDIRSQFEFVSQQMQLPSNVKLQRRMLRDYEASH